jgi:hypothetical protein
MKIKLWEVRGKVGGLNLVSPEEGESIGLED